MKKYLVGFGNISMGDDSVGLRIVDEICERGLDRGFEAIEAGNDGLSVLALFDDATDLIVIVDCVVMGRKPGEIVCFSPEDVTSGKQVGNISTHEGDVLKIVEVGRQTGYPVPKIRIVGIEPQSVAWGMELSPALNARMEEYVSVTLAEIGAADGSRRC